MTESGSCLSRVPRTVLLVLGLTEDNAYLMGMRGCGLQLGHDGEWSWPETTVTLSSQVEEVQVFLHVRSVENTVVKPGLDLVRVSIQQMLDYVQMHEAIREFLVLHRRYRYLRLGANAFVPSWELDSHDAFLIRMPSDEFDRHFVADPRGQPSYGEVARRLSRHRPTMLSRPRGLPDPGQGGWM